MGLTRHKVTQKTPHAAVLIWNYRDRLGSDLSVKSSRDVNAVESLIISTVSLKSITTNKTKRNPAGSFSIQLAPTKNWVGTITSGSWMVVLMSQNKIKERDFSRASPSKVKFFGRIESVRVNVVTDANGARKTMYTVTGKDWGTIFENIVYIDALAQSQGGIQNATALGLAFIAAEKDKEDGC